MEKKHTNYVDGTVLEIIETTFHDYPMGAKVKVVNSDLYNYLVVNITDKMSEKRWWWVGENQVKPFL